ncbi:signal peptidase [Phaffia rhodozyma]|uniref:Mitochondrial inner membrane protease subunit 2 n=1 Tax=Phaffia rhodozyma TaxID=264483 RepID=A0A0F7SMV0_PHARH|nr:signal peptidase [Phaffia rhodozyma]
MAQARVVPRSLPRLSILKLALWIPVGIFAIDHVGEVVSVEGSSMSPTLNPDWKETRRRDWIFLNKWHVTWKKPWHRGDVVTLWSPTSDTRRLTVKRIIGIEGDTIRTNAPYPEKFVKLEKGQVWVEGDNDLESKDSRIYGPVPISLLQSRVSHVIYPPSHYTTLDPLPPFSSSSDKDSIHHSRVVPPPRLNTIHRPMMGRLPGSEGVGWGGKHGLGEGESSESEERSRRRRESREQRVEH